MALISNTNSHYKIPKTIKEFSYGVMTVKMKGDRVLRKVVSECSESANPCKRHQNPVFTWFDQAARFRFGGCKVTSDPLKTLTYYGPQYNDNNMYSGKQLRPIHQGSEALKIITSKTKNFRRSLSESYKQRTVVCSERVGSGATKEQIVPEDRFTTAFIAGDYIYQTHAPYRRRNAICDEIEKYIIHEGATLRSLRRDLIVAVNLSNWHLL